MVQPPVLVAIRPSHQHCPSGLAPCPRQDLHLPPGPASAPHFGAAMPGHMSPVAHHEPGRHALGHGLKRIMLAGLRGHLTQ
jgi:hypothetical protein